jgi:deoxycytidine triphosphate deaminase
MINSASPPTWKLRERLSDQNDPFTITPLPNPSRIGQGSIDLSLGRTFLVSVRASVLCVSTANPSDSNRLFTEVRLPTGGELTVQSHQFVLAATQEYLRLPTDLCGFLQSRSTFGRLGLIAATATYITAGYQGCPTLELFNAGEVPIVLRPEDEICQLVLMSADERPEDLKASRYQCATRPYPARLTDQHENRI